MNRQSSQERSEEDREIERAKAREIKRNNTEQCRE